MEQSFLNPTDFENLLKCFDVEAVAEHLSSIGFLDDEQLMHIKGLGKKQEIVTYLHHIIEADSSRFDTFLDEFDFFIRKNLSTNLDHILEIKKTRSRFRIQTQTKTLKTGHVSESNSKPLPLKLKPDVTRKTTQLESTDCLSDVFKHVSM